jgi:PKD repeat protein
MKKNYSKITKQMLLGLTLVFYLSSFTSAQQTGTIPDCNVYGFIFGNPGDTNGCEYNILTDDGVLLNPVEFKPPLPIVDSVYIHFSYELTNNYSCQGEPVIIHCFDVVDSLKYCEAAIELYRVDCDSANDGIDCEGNIYQFVAITNPKAISLTWSINSKVVSRDESFIHNFTEPGNYQVSLETLTEDTCYAKAVKYINVPSNPIDSCWVTYRYKETFNNDSSVTYEFYPSASDSIAGFLWYVDGELVSEDPELSIQFTEPGSHNVCIKVETIAGCEAEYCNEIYINPCEINVGIVYYPVDSITENKDSLTYHIYGVTDADNEPVSWVWRIEGQVVSTQRAFDHTFTEDGYYPIDVSVSNEIGCQGQSYDTIVIEGLVEYCQAGFYYYEVTFEDSLDNSQVDGRTIQFINTSAGEGLQYTWNFGDGTSSSEENPAHTYSSTGVYDVSLLIHSYTTNCYDSILMQVKVGTSTDCYAGFYYYEISLGDSIDDQLGENLSYGKTYQFINTSEGMGLSYDWYFGDGVSSSEENPVHTFSQPGLYDVILTIESANNYCYDTVIKKVSVDSIIMNCKAYFEYCMYNENTDDSSYYDTVVSGQGNLIVGFKNLSVPANYSSFWDFGDGTYSYEKNPVHRYQESGVYEVCLKITSPGGCSDTYCEFVKAGIPDCEVDFTYNVIVPSCEGFNIAYEFNPVSTSNAVSYTWTFGDGETSSANNPIHLYESYGVYEICVQAYYDDECIAKKCKKIDFRQADIDSAFLKKCLSTPVIVLEQKEGISLKEIYPLPAKGSLTIIIESVKEQQVQIELVDILGKNYKLYSNEWLNAGENILELDLSGLKTGNYVYMLTSDLEVTRGQIIIVE